MIIAISASAFYLLIIFIILFINFIFVMTAYYYLYKEHWRNEEHGKKNKQEKHL